MGKYDTLGVVVRPVRCRDGRRARGCTNPPGTTVLNVGGVGAHNVRQKIGRVGAVSPDAAAYAVVKQKISVRRCARGSEARVTDDQSELVGRKCYVFDVQA